MSQDNNLIKNFELLIAIRRAGLTQRELSRRVGLHESIISKVINGRHNLNSLERMRITETLRVKEGEIFEVQ